MLELTLEGGVECYQAFQAEDTACAKAQRQCKGLSCSANYTQFISLEQEVWGQCWE